jgi:hypothetical protein
LEAIVFTVDLNQTHTAVESLSDQLLSLTSDRSKLFEAIAILFNRAVAIAIIWDMV